MVLAAVSVLLFASAGTAFAAWVSEAKGVGSVTTATPSLSGEARASGVLAPGAQSVTHVRLANPNPGPVTVVSLTGGAARILHAGNGSCDPASVSFVAREGLSVRVPAGGAVAVDGVIAMSSSAGNGCQHATFSVPVTARVVTR